MKKTSSTPVFSRVTDIQDSSNIDTVAFDPIHNIVKVCFISGGAYLYYDVKPEEFGALVSADSVGGYFSIMFSRRHRFEKV